MSKWFTNTIFFLLLLPFLATGQDAVQLKCIEVTIDNDVTISWTISAITTDFLKYEMYYSTNGTSFSKIGEISNSLTNTYIHVGANANLGRRFYYVNTVYTGGQAASAILSSIFLQVDNNDPIFNQADLFWNPLSEPLPAGSSGIYKIYEEYPLGNWFEISSTASLNETFEIIVCLDSISFRIEMENSEGCVSVSNVSGAIFKDAIYPQKPVFDSVSIDAAGKPVLGWTPAIDLDVEGYVIYRLENAAWIEIHRIDGRDSVFYTDESANPCSEVITYAIASFDSCGNKSPGTFPEPLNTILLENVIFDVCSMNNTVSWSPYINPTPGLEGYRVFCSIDGGAFLPVGFVAPDKLTFNHTGLVEGTTYTYFVKVEFGGKSSSSCKQSITTYGYLKPHFVYLANASVLPSNAVELTIDVDTLVNDCVWEIWSSNGIDPSPNFVTSITRSELTGFPLVVTDESADAAVAYFNYLIIVKDSCGKETLESNQLTTIHLTGTTKSTEQNQLDWTAFEGWEEGVEKYYIFRFSGDEISPLPIDSVGPETLTYTDDIAAVDNVSGVFGYWVQAKQNQGNPFGYVEKSNSNRVYLAEETTMFMPNAFRPGGINNEFKPVYKYFSGSQYLLQVYNRWGQLIFETNNPSTGWTGMYNGQMVPFGVYVYRLVYSNLENQPVLMNGTVTVVQ